MINTFAIIGMCVLASIGAIAAACVYAGILRVTAWAIERLTEGW